jgi:hypothetical protein
MQLVLEPTSSVATEKRGNAATRCRSISSHQAQRANTLRRADCQAGTCFSGGCEGFSSEYSTDGKCGVLHNNIRCGGKWGNCCGIPGICGTGEAFCGVGKCQNGNCTIVIPAPPDRPAATTTTPILAPTSTPGGISPDGSCGGSNKYRCIGSTFGNCCNASGCFGTTTGHCTTGCQAQFGTCTTTNISPDGTCAGTNKYQCKGSQFGDCCSASGCCGSTTGHCTAGCQGAFGLCTSTDISSDGTCGGSKK